MPLRTIARMTAFRPGQSPPPVSTPIRIGAQDNSIGSRWTRRLTRSAVSLALRAAASARTAAARSATARRGRHAHASTRACPRRASRRPRRAPSTAGERLALAERRRPAAGLRSSSCRSTRDRARGAREPAPGAPARERERATARPTTRRPSPTSASSTSGPRRSRCRSRTTPGCCRCRPRDGLTSLTAAPPGRPRAGPERYYPTGRAQLRAARPDTTCSRSRCCSS